VRSEKGGNGLFRAGEEPWIPDTAEFHHIVEGKARLLKFSASTE
jgi:hypothetical protein